MRIVWTVLAILAVAGGAVALALVLRKARRQKDHTPQLATVAALLEAPREEADQVTGRLGGRAVTYANRSTRYTAYTELAIAAPGAEVLLELRAPSVGEVPALVAGAPTVDANTIVRALQPRIAALHPSKIVVDASGVTITADRVITDDADARALVELGVELATRAKTSSAPAATADAQRAQVRAAQAERRRTQIIGGAIVLLLIAAGTVVGVRAMLAKRRAAATQPAP